MHHWNAADGISKHLIDQALFFYAEASVWGGVDGGNGLLMAMAGEYGYVEKQVAFFF